MPSADGMQPNRVRRPGFQRLKHGRSGSKTTGDDQRCLDPLPHLFRVFQKIGFPLPGALLDPVADHRRTLIDATGDFDEVDAFGRDLICNLHRLLHRKTTSKGTRTSYIDPLDGAPSSGWTCQIPRRCS